MLTVSQPPIPPTWADVHVGADLVTLLKDGEQAYPAMLAAIAAATETICLETYELRDDSTGMRFLKALMERAGAGVVVLLMFDAWGSDVSEGSLVLLARAGVAVSPFRPWRLTGSLARVLTRHRRRNHRKSLVVDGCIGFTGGMNISDDYAALTEGGAGWRDTHLRIVGPGARALETLFLKTWQRNRGPVFAQGPFRRPPVSESDSLRIVGNGYVRERKLVRRAYEEAFERAKTRIFVTNAYFLPPARLVRTLIDAASRGVRVAVILAATTDVKLVLYAGRSLYPMLLAAGIELYEWRGERVLHAKTAVVDGQWTTVGSTNLDPLSLTKNLEVNAIVIDAELGAATERLFLADLVHCQRITFDSITGYGLIERAFAWLAWRFRLWL